MHPGYRVVWMSIKSSAANEQILHSKRQWMPRAPIATGVVCTQKGAEMKTILYLHDEAAHPMCLLEDAMPAKVPLRATEALIGCNCDRWGHPCLAHIDRGVETKAEFSTKSNTKK